MCHSLALDRRPGGFQMNDGRRDGRGAVENRRERPSLILYIYRRFKRPVNPKLEVQRIIMDVITDQ